MRLAISIWGAVLIGLLALLSLPSGDGASAKSTLQVDHAQKPGAKEWGWHKVDAGPFSILAP